MACAYFGLDCKVFMVKISYEQKPFRREVMRTYGANVTPSPSDTTAVGRKMLEEFPGTGGSLGCAISEAVEDAVSTPGYRYVLGSVLNQVLLHQSVIGLETKAALDKYGVKPRHDHRLRGRRLQSGASLRRSWGEKLRGEADYRIIAVEPASCPSFTREDLPTTIAIPEWSARSRNVHPRQRLYSRAQPRGRAALPRHERHPVQLYHDGYMEAVAVEQTAVSGPRRSLPASRGSCPHRRAPRHQGRIDEATRMPRRPARKKPLCSPDGHGLFRHACL
jgi:tryptophan synthase beta chain